MLASLATLILAVASPTFRALAEHIERSGGLVGAIADGEDQNGVRGLHATAAIPVGEPLLVLPPGAYLTSAAEPTCTESSTWALEPPLKPFERLLIALLEARAADGQHHVYLSSLPARVDLLRDWSPDELALLQSDWLATAAASQRTHCEGTCSRLDAMLTTLYPDAEARREALWWAEAMVRSRALGVEDDKMVLLPIFDLINHRSRRRRAPGPAAERRQVQDGGTATEEREKRKEEVLADPTDAPPSLVVTDDGGIVLLAGADLSAGQPIEIEYRQEAGGNGALLLEYGFAEALPAGVPPRELVHVPLHLPHGVSEEEVLLGSDAHDAHAIATLGAALRASSSSAGGGSSSGSGRREDAAVAAALLERVEAVRAHMPTTEADDARELARLDGAPPPPSAIRIERRRAALHFRVAQKRQLASTARALREYLREEAAHESAHAKTTTVHDALREARHARD